MEIQELIGERVIANIKIATKKETGYPKKLPYFNVEEDKVTSYEMVIYLKSYIPMTQLL